MTTAALIAKLRQVFIEEAHETTARNVAINAVFGAAYGYTLATLPILGVPLVALILIADGWLIIETIRLARVKKRLAALTGLNKALDSGNGAL